jgi:hypothetical protein
MLDSVHRLQALVKPAEPNFILATLSEQIANPAVP